VIEDCLDHLHEAPSIESEISLKDNIEEILDLTGTEHCKWLIDLLSKLYLTHERLMTKAREVIADDRRLNHNTISSLYSNRNELRYSTFLATDS
jgi:hypothetical protein